MSSMRFAGPLERVEAFCWRIPRRFRRDMRVDGLVYADETLIADLRHDPALEQVANVACLPGIQRASLAMPDIHWGYGFPIGGVCATDPGAGGVISPGGVGYDINCGVRLVRSNLLVDEVRPVLDRLIDALFAQIPAGVGRGGRHLFSRPQLRELLAEGAPALVRQGLAVDADIRCTEAEGRLAGAAPDRVSDRALDRGADQCGTLGAGNHFLEVQAVDAIFDRAAADVLGLEQDRVCLMIHSGSRGLGYQVCDDALRALRGAPAEFGIDLPDRQLACAPLESAPGRNYLGAMRAAANFAWCNRQLLMWDAREVFARVFGRPWEALGLRLVYDVAHNIAKLEQHEIDGVVKEVCVHRKGATRAFPPGHPELPAVYQGVGQPVLAPGDMGRASWVLVGREGSMRRTFGSACHGAGRALSRHAAARLVRGQDIQQRLRAQGVVIRARSWKCLAEEQPAAYKDVDRVVQVMVRAGIAAKVARLRPIGVIKG